MITQQLENMSLSESLILFISNNEVCNTDYAL